MLIEKWSATFWLLSRCIIYRHFRLSVSTLFFVEHNLVWTSLDMLFPPYCTLHVSCFPLALCPTLSIACWLSLYFLSLFLLIPFHSNTCFHCKIANNNRWISVMTANWLHSLDANNSKSSLSNRKEPFSIPAAWTLINWWPLPYYLPFMALRNLRCSNSNNDRVQWMQCIRWHDLCPRVLLIRFIPTIRTIPINPTDRVYRDRNRNRVPNEKGHETHFQKKKSKLHVPVHDPVHVPVHNLAHVLTHDLRRLRWNRKNLNFIGPKQCNLQSVPWWVQLLRLAPTIPIIRCIHGKEHQRIRYRADRAGSVNWAKYHLQRVPDRLSQWQIRWPLQRDRGQIVKSILM